MPVENVRHSLGNASVRGGRALANNGFVGVASNAQPTAADLLSHLVHSSAEFAGVMFQSAVAVLGLGIGAYFEHKLAMRDHDQEEKRMAALYRREIAEQMRTSPSIVGVAHLKAAAQDNPALAGALERNDKKVRLRMGTWIACATLAAFTTWAIFFPPMALAAPLLAPLFHTLGAGAAAKITFFALKFAAGLTVFHTAKPFVERLGAKAMGLDESDARDPAGLFQERSLEPARAQSVAIARQPDLAETLPAPPEKASFVERYAQNRSPAISRTAQIENERAGAVLQPAWEK